MRALIVDADDCRTGLTDVVSALHLGWAEIQIEQVHARDLQPGLATTLRADLIVVGTSNRGVSWLANVRRIRQVTPAVIVAVSTEYNESDLIEAAEAGADVFLEVPIRLPSFVARVRPILNRVNAQRFTPQPAVCGDLSVDPELHEARLNGRLLALTPTEFHILHCLAERGGRVSTKELLCTRIWDEDRILDATTLRKHIQQLRRKISAVPQAKASIVTIAGIGHKLVTDNDDERRMIAG